MRIKICGITQPDQGQAIVQLGISTLGFMCVHQSPRYVTAEQIRAIVDQLPSLSQLPQSASGQTGIERVGVFVEAGLAEIQEVVRIANLNGVQLHGQETPQFCRQIREAMPDLTIIKAFRVRDAATLAETEPYQAVVDALLLDAYRPGAVHPGQYGGTGHTIAWGMLRDFRPACPWFLAGGLTPQNLHEALQQIQPDGIDVSSGVEHAPGQKDLQKVTALIAALRQLELCPT
jgi:phosphoribosylanthranilate isomerase